MQPDEPIVTDEPTTEPAPEGDNALTYTFPFAVPESLSAASDDDLRALHQTVREHASTLAGTSPAETSEDALLGLRACRDLAVEIRDEVNRRADLAAQQAADAAERADLAAELDGLDLPAAPEPAPAAVTASTRRVLPSARQVAATRRTTTPPVPDARTEQFASLTASSDFAGFTTGQEVTMAGVAAILAKRVEQYPESRTSRNANPKMAKRPVTVYDPDVPGRVLEMRSYTRHAGVQIRRQYPEGQYVDHSNASQGYEIASALASERRLPGGSLVESLRLASKGDARRALTAAAGWCAPSDVIYDLVELETLEGLLEAPELQTPRGGWQIPEHGGPDFSTIWSAIGNSGDTHLSEAQVIAESPAKVCTDISCPDFEEVRLGVDYVCLTGGLLQRRGYPEAVARFTRASVIALAHKINKGFINALVLGSDSRILSADASGDDAASSLLNSVELAVLDIRYRNRMSFNATVEVVLPAWVKGAIRAGLARRTGVALLNVTDAMIMDWFAERGAVVRLVYDWQDNYDGSGLGAALPAAAYPVRAKFLAYPAGTWLKAVQDVVDLDTVYDSTNLTTNQYVALFTETGWAALKMGPTSYLYDVPVPVSGVTGCCPDEAIS